MIAGFQPRLGGMASLLRYVARRASRSYQALRGIRSRKKALQSALVARRSQLSPGWYRLDLTVAYRIGSPVPTGLRQTMKHRMSPQLYPLKAHVVRALDLAVPPIVVRLKEIAGDRRETASQLMISRCGDARLFNPISRTVTTFHSDERRSEQILTAYAALRGTLPVVEMDLTADGRGITEELIGGAIFSEASAHHQIHAYKQLLAAYTAHTASAERLFWSRHAAEAEFDGALKLQLPQEVRSRLLARKSTIIDGLEAAPSVMSHGDLHHRNVLLGHTGPVMVDIELGSYKRFFYDPLTLPHTAARDDRPFLLRSISAGTFDQELNQLINVADMRISLDRDLLWLMFLVVRLNAKQLHANTPASRVRYECAPFLESHLV